MKREEIVEKLLQQTGEEFCDEETFDLLLGKKYTSPTLEEPSFSQKIADKVARIAGSWGFILLFAFSLFLWMLMNIHYLTNPFDPYPFVLLNLVLSCISAFQAPLIMMAQNRQDQKDRLRQRNDYLIDIKTSLMIEEVYKKIDQIIKNQEEILANRNKE